MEAQGPQVSVHIGRGESALRKIAGLIVSVALLASCLIVAGCQSEEESLVSKKCLASCHNMKELEEQSLNEDQWLARIADMEEVYGVQVTDEERSTIAKYFVQQEA